MDVTDVARQVRMPTLVLHDRGDDGVPFDEGRRPAALFQCACFVPLDSANHARLDSEPARADLLAGLGGFSGAAPTMARGEVGAGDDAFTRTESEVCCVGWPKGSTTTPSCCG